MDGQLSTAETLSSNQNNVAPIFEFTEEQEFCSNELGKMTYQINKLDGQLYIHFEFRDFKGKDDLLDAYEYFDVIKKNILEHTSIRKINAIAMENDINHHKFLEMFGFEATEEWLVRVPKEAKIIRYMLELN